MGFNFAPHGDIWQCLETLVVIVTTSEGELCWHLVRRGHGDCKTFYSNTVSVTKNYLASNARVPRFRPWFKSIFNIEMQIFIWNPSFKPQSLRPKQVRKAARLSALPIDWRMQWFCFRGQGIVLITIMGREFTIQ